MSNNTWFETTGFQSAIAMSGHGSAFGMSPCAYDVVVSTRLRGTDVAIVKAFPGSHAWSPPI